MLPTGIAEDDSLHREFVLISNSGIVRSFSRCNVNSVISFNGFKLNLIPTRIRSFCLTVVDVIRTVHIDSINSEAFRRLETNSYIISSLHFIDTIFRSAYRHLDVIIVSYCNSVPGFGSIRNAIAICVYSKDKCYLRIRSYILKSICSTERSFSGIRELDFVTDLDLIKRLPFSRCHGEHNIFTESYGFF